MSVEELEHKIEESDEAMEKKAAWQKTMVKLEGVVSLTELADSLLDKLEKEDDWKPSGDEEAVIEELVDDLDWDIDLEDLEPDKSP